MNWMEKKPTSFNGYQSRVYECRVNDGTLRVFVGKEPLGPGKKLQWHLSISHRGLNSQTDRIPTWDEIKDARYRFCPDEAYMAMILPPEEEYVNLHQTTMHLHEIDK